MGFTYLSYSMDEGLFLSVNSVVSPAYCKGKGEARDASHERRASEIVC